MTQKRRRTDTPKQQSGLLCREEEYQLGSQVHQGGVIGDAARDRLVAANVRLVHKIAQRYRRLIGPAMDYDDMVQEGMLGLLTAIEKFDPDRGWKFSTCATWWIRQAISRAIADKGESIRLPVHVQTKLHLLGQTRQRLEQEAGRKERGEPTDLEVINALDLSACMQEVLPRLQQQRQLRSLDEPVSGSGESEDLMLGSLLVDNRASTEDEALGQVQASEIEEVMRRKLTSRECDALRLRYGLMGGGEHTLDEVGKALGGLSRERVRQIVERALSKMREQPVLVQAMLV
jgi:RNA polymerase primary sigma factor